MAYKNGSIPASALRTVLGVPMLKGTANAVERMAAAARADGVILASYIPAGGYRSLALQRDMKYTSNPGKYGMSKYTQSLLSSPGHSPHGMGRAIDFSTGRAWLIKHAKSFGFARPLADADPNHWIHNGRTAISTIIPADSGNVTPIEKETFMARLVSVKSSSAVYLLEEFSATRVPSALLAAAIAAHGDVVEYSKQASLDGMVHLSRTNRTALVNEIAVAVPKGTTDTAAILAAITGIPAAVDAQLDDEQAQLMAGLAAIPAATLAAFGLKRA